MNNADFWASISSIITNGFTPDGLQKLDRYAELFISGRLIYQRFSPLEQHGCAEGGETHVIASLLSGAETETNYNAKANGSDFERECKQGKEQEKRIEKWAKTVGCWTENTSELLAKTLGEHIAEGGEAKVYDHGSTLIKEIGLDYFILPILALDRISLHNAYFPETKFTVIGFGRNAEGDFKILVEQPFIEGTHASDEEIDRYMAQMGFQLRNKRNWTYAKPEIYLSDIHDENVIKSASGTIFVIDCDIRINTPELKEEGKRILTNTVSFKQ